MKNDLFEIIIDGQSYTSDEFRTLCKYNKIELSIYSDGMLDSLVAQWNMTMPIGRSAVLMFDGEVSSGFKRKVYFAPEKDVDFIADPRNSKGKY